MLIDPKMSFGTAHHETTSLIIEQMLQENFQGKKVLDMGCGTGVLAILAEMMGASLVDAIDNDPNACENAQENVNENKCRNINVHLGVAENINAVYDVILVNINKNTLIKDMERYSSHLTGNGIILFSGFYMEDLEVIRLHAQNTGLVFDKAEYRNNWIVARFTKQN